MGIQKNWIDKILVGILVGMLSFIPLCNLNLSELRIISYVVDLGCFVYLSIYLHSSLFGKRIKQGHLIYCNECVSSKG